MPKFTTTHGISHKPHPPSKNLNVPDTRYFT